MINCMNHDQSIFFSNEQVQQQQIPLVDRTSKLSRSMAPDNNFFTPGAKADGQNMKSHKPSLKHNHQLSLFSQFQKRAPASGHGSTQDMLENGLGRRSRAMQMSDAQKLKQITTPRPNMGQKQTGSQPGMAHQVSQIEKSMLSRDSSTESDTNALLNSTRNAYVIHSRLVNDETN